MTRTMYDGVTPSRIPASATMVAGYADGHYANLPALRSRFPHATIVSIAVSWTTRAQVLDVEQGDATPAQAVKWCTQTMHDKPNGELTVYCNTSVWAQVKETFARAGVTHPQYWIADWDGSTAIPAGAVAKQYKNAPGYDVSAVAAHWPGVDTATPAKPRVSLKNLIAACKADPPARQGHTTHPADVRPVEEALVAEGLLRSEYARDGSFGSLTKAAYSSWQRSKAGGGYSGADADGIPGEASLKKLGQAHGFTVVA